MKIFIVIAAYNEEKSIEKVVSNLKKAGYRDIVVVDDGSKDKTYQVIKRLNIHALHHLVNRGQGASLKTGIDYALKNGADIIVTFDADGQHKVEDIQSMIRPLIKKQCDATIGSRFLKRTNMPLLRRITLKMGVFIMWLFYGVKMTDAHNGFRALSRDAAKKIEITSDRMEHASQIIEEIHKKKIKYMEIPVTIRYTDYSMNKGHGGVREAVRVFGKMFLRKVLK